jgi:hypothetical protein
VPLKLGVPVKVPPSGQTSSVELVVRLSLDTNQVGIHRKSLGAPNS